jgi:hypothetical protein
MKGRNESAAHWSNSMTNQQHPITPPPELVQQWMEELYGGPVSVISPFDQRVLIAVAQWGADQQLAEDAEWLDHNALNDVHLKIIPLGEALKEAMRPKPPSLKEQALEALDRMDQFPTANDQHIIRRALEQLDD